MKSDFLDAQQSTMWCIVIWTWLRSCKFHILSLKNEICEKEERSGKVVYYFICHYRLRMEPQTRNCGARQGHDPPAIPLSAIIIKSTFFCLPLKTLLNKSLSRKFKCYSELDFPFLPWCGSLTSPFMLVRALSSLSSYDMTGRLKNPHSIRQSLGFSLTLEEAHQDGFRCHLASSSHSLERLLGP